MGDHERKLSRSLIEYAKTLGFSPSLYIAKTGSYYVTIDGDLVIRVADHRRRPLSTATYNLDNRHGTLEGAKALIAAARGARIVPWELI